MTIVTGKHEETLCGLTARSFMLASIDPLMITVAIAPSRHSYGIIKSSGYFAVNILSETQLELARRFGWNSGHTMNKYHGVEFEHGALTESPIFPASLAYLECRLDSRAKAGDHELFVGEVLAHGVNSELTALQYRQEDYIRN